MTAVLETRHLTKYYGRQRSRGIVDLDLRVLEGDFFGFIGPNGAGKSTTIRILLGLVAPSSGEALLFGRDCRRERTALLADVGYMPSESAFYPGMGGGVGLGLAARLLKRAGGADAARLCERLSLDPNRRVEELSLGNRKKVSIVCALQHRPPLYILDEPTSGLDPLMQRAFLSLLEERHREGATVFRSSHVLSEIQRHCRNAAIIRDGSIVAADTVGALSRSAARRVQLRGVDRVPNLAGVADLTVQEDSVSFLYRGEVPQLIEALNGWPLTDISIAEPDIEEMFLHFYREEEQL